jgi:Fic family protein
MSENAERRADWPSHGARRMPWSQDYRSGSREDRDLREVTVALPPAIAAVDVRLDNAVIAAMEDAAREVVALDHEHGADLLALGAILLRTESVASSKIERVEASTDDYARALHGNRSNAAATAMAAATTAIATLITSVDRGRPVRIESVLYAHRALMFEDPGERAYAGRFRDMQNWIGGSDHSPRNALFVPPPPDTVAGYIDDLVAFTNRDDLPVLVQAAIAHAQFESIHPFTDGNGRIGRAIINTVLRRRGTTQRVIVPIASALVAHRDRYFDLLDDYRTGDVEPLVLALSAATRIAASEARLTADRVVGLPAAWCETLGRVRTGSATDRLLARLTELAAFTAEDAHDDIGGPVSSTYTAIERLAEAGIIRPLTDRKRSQVWGTAAVLDELDDLGARIAKRARSTGDLGAREATHAQPRAAFEARATESNGSAVGHPW